MKQFAHLHLHTEYSLLDGAVRINQLFSQCDKLNIPAVAITDHGNMYGALEFVKAAVRYTDPKADPYKFLQERREFKVKPIIGCEMYTTDDIRIKTNETKHSNHIILLCKNQTGYNNLIKLCSIGFTEGMYYRPRIDFELLKAHSEGLICLSACLAGVIPQCLLKGDTIGADKWVQKFKQVFKDDFYIEIQDHRLLEQRRILPILIQLAQRNDVKIVATNDVHYLHKEDALMQKVLQNIAFQRTMSPDEGFASEGIVQSEGDYFPTDEFYLKSPEEMIEMFGSISGAIENTLEIANKCGCYFFKKEKLFPVFEPPQGYNSNEYLRKLCYDGLKQKYGQFKEEITSRAEYELSTIETLGFVDYYLIVWDFINYAENNGVSVGPGRGSGVGSIVAYAIGITKVDPLKYSLIFERFLNKERVSNPDFDIDFCVEGREKVIEYVVNKYGADNVSQIITFSTLAAKAAIKDVGRVFDLPYNEVDRLTKLMPKIMGKYGIEHILGLKPTKDGTNPVVPELVEIYNNDPQAKQIMDMAIKIEGMPRQTGMHAAGVIICKDAISNHIPLAKSTDGIVTTQFNMNECEELGLLKMDFLGLTTLTDISKTIGYVKKSKGKDIDFYNMDYDDAEVFKLISEGDTQAVFQLESGGMTKFMRELRPTSLEDIIAGISLYRPGPMEKIGEYIQGKRNEENIHYDHPIMQPILKVTYGVMVYQEQVMAAVRALAGYSLGRADIVRRLMSKKRADEMEREREVFLYGTADGSVVGCIKNGIELETANKIFDDMTSFASYAFNKSHAAAYAYLAYQTAYLKRYHKVEFITAVLNNRITKIDEVSKYLMYLKLNKIDVLPPDINKSEVEFSVEGDKVRVGFAALKNVGTSVVSVIVSERERGGSFKSFEDFVSRMQTALQNQGKNTLNKKLLESLILAGAFDSFGINRCSLICSYDMVLDRVRKDAAAALSGQVSFFENMDITCFEYPSMNEYNHEFKLKKEKEVAGVYLSGHPLEQYSDKLKQFEYNTVTIKSLEEDIPQKIILGGMLTEASIRYTKMGKELGVGIIEDLYGSAEVLITADRLSKYRSLWQKETLVTLYCRVSQREEDFSVWVDKIEAWDKEQKNSKKMCIYFGDKAEMLKSLPEITQILQEYPGSDEVYICYIEQGKKRLNLFSAATVSACDMLKNELLGYICVKDIKVSD